MKTTIDKAGRVVIPAALRERAGFGAGGLSPSDAHLLLTKEVIARMTVHDLPPDERAVLLKTALEDGTVGGRIYDVHIAEVARAAGATVIVTDNRRHFLASLKHGTRVETPSEFLKASA